MTALSTMLVAGQTKLHKDTSLEEQRFINLVVCDVPNYNSGKPKIRWPDR